MVSKNGFKIESVTYGNHIFKPKQVYSFVPPYSPLNKLWDYIIVTIKSIPNNPVPNIIRKGISSSHTKIVLLQNGIHIENSCAAEFPQNPLISGVTYIAVVQKEQGVITHTGLNNIVIGAFKGKHINPSVWEKADEAAKVLVDILKLKESSSVDWVEDIQMKRWHKIVWNAGNKSKTAFFLLLFIITTISVLNGFVNAKRRRRKKKKKFHIFLQFFNSFS